MGARIEVIPVGNLGNQMLQLMLLTRLQGRLPNLELGGLELPDWGLRLGPGRPLGPSRLRLIGQYVDMARLEPLLSGGSIRELEFAALGFQMRHYLPRQHYQAMFARRPGNVPEGLADRLLINVRGAEILSDTHADYGPIPIDFYRQLVASTGLRPMFMGQIGDDSYSQTLRDAFPDAPVIPSRGPMGDFELMRSARQLVVSVSTFSWLAAWLSDAQVVHLPVFGMFNPAQRPDIDLLPVDDPRYRFYRFPVRHWTGSREQFDALTAPAPSPEMHRAELQTLLANAAASLEAQIRRYRRRLATRAWLHRWAGVSGRVGLMT